jgi:hypothetical protein
VQGELEPVLFATGKVVAEGERLLQRVEPAADGAGPEEVAALDLAPPGGVPALAHDLAADRSQVVVDRQFHSIDPTSPGFALAQ